jgi:hypothetical protein
MVTVTTAPPPPPPPVGGYLFASDWSTSLGSTPQALQDGGRWNGPMGGETSVRVVPSTGLDFPTSNVLDVYFATGSSSGFFWVQKTGLPIPAVGESRYYRWYMRVTQPDQLQDNGTHPIQSEGAGAWDFEIENRAGTFVPRWDNGSYHWVGPMLQKNRTYRFEFHLYRNGSSTYNLHARVYDSAGNLIGDDDDFRLEFPAGQTLASLPAPNLNLGSGSALQSITAGNNGLAGTNPYPFTYSFQAAFCIRADRWCGPYTPGEGR